MRVYVPLTFAGLAALERDGALGPAPIRAYAVTADVVAALPRGDEEEHEYAALSAAADASLALVAATPGTAPRRVVVVADVPDALVESAAGDDAHPALVVVTVPLPRQRLAALHVDERAAKAHVLAALAGDAAALDDVELLWFGVQELAAVLRS